MSPLSVSRLVIIRRLLILFLTAVLPFVGLTGCQTAPGIVATTQQDFGALAPGDVLKVTFPGAPELNQVVKVRADGKMSLPIIGDQEAAGKSVGALQAEIAKLYRKELQNTEVFISLQTSTTAVYLSGAVARPGKILLDSPDFPAQWQGTAAGARDALLMLRDEPTLDWTLLSPSAHLEPGPRTGQFRLGLDQLLVDAAGKSHISVADYAVAMIDELEQPAHSRRRFTVGY